MDTLTPEKRSWNMSRIKAKNTSPERRLRTLLHRSGFRFRLHAHDLPGKPDIVLPKYRTVIFVNGCFWHRHEGCPFAYIPKSRTEFWLPKFQKTIERDLQKSRELECAGWNVIVAWECEIKSAPEQTLARVIDEMTVHHE
ncbi:very short patch repair endonuclease [Pseudohongiella spirulinae]|uniref:very short patch repair endonuclease n=1 Tax=Pseudohongiella spirulinae TaxID=1249552 RepID=UPI002FF73D51